MHAVTLLRKSLLLATAILFSQTGLALAQGAGTDERVTVDGSYTIRHATVQERTPLREVSRVTVSRAVSYSDIDLGKAAGVEALAVRIRDAAKDVCHELDRRYPATASYDAECARTAANTALAQATRIAVSRTGSPMLAALP